MVCASTAASYKLSSVDPVPLYETTIYNRDGDDAATFVSVPARALPDWEAPRADRLAEILGLREVSPAQLWSLPFFLDAAFGRRDRLLEFEPPWWELRRLSPRGPSPFAQYLVYSPAVPFEASPLEGKSLAELMAPTGGIGAVVAAYAFQEPLILIAVPAGMVICGAARGVAEALHIGLRARLLSWMGIPEPPSGEPSDEGPGESGDR